MIVNEASCYGAFALLRILVVVVILAFSVRAFAMPQGNDPRKALALLDTLERAVAEGDDGKAEALLGSFRALAEEVGTPFIVGDDLTFVVFADAMSDSVTIIGSFDEEKGDITLDLARVGALGLWVARCTVRTDAEFIYNVQVNGGYTHDALCKRWFTGLGKHSVVRMPDYDPWVDRAVMANVPRGTTETFDIKPKTLEGTRTIRVYLPRGYGEGEKRYPVLYVHDGAQAYADGHFDRIADYLIAEGRMVPLIMCFVPHNNRWHEYGEGANEHAEFLVNEVVAQVDSRYRTLPDAQHRGVTGASMGGRISTYLVTHHSDVFRTCIGQSTYLEEGSTIIEDLKSAEDLPVRFYYDIGVFEHSVGERDLVVVNRELRDLLRSQGHEVTYREWPGVHCWLMWSRSIGEALPLLWPPTREGE